MLSTDTRLQIEFICRKIERKEELDIKEMIWVQKWADRNRHVYEMVRSARRKALSEKTPLDELLNGLNLGDPDPSSHLTGSSDTDKVAEFFKRNSGEHNDRLRRD